MPTAKPARMLPVLRAATKATIAVNRIEPSNERLMTPDFSVIVSPSTAKIMGGEAARTVARIMARLMLSPPSDQARLQTLRDQDDEDQQALDHTAQRRVELALDRELQAAHGDRGEEKRDRYAPEGVQVGQQHHQDGQEAIAARNEREKVVTGARADDQHPARQTRQGAAERKRQQEIAVGGHAGDKGRA